MTTLTLTQEVLATGLQCPPGKKRVELCDAEVPGVYIEVRATTPGEGTYYLRHKDLAGKTCHRKIGRTTDTTLAEARRQGKALKADLQPEGSRRSAARAGKIVKTWARFLINDYLPFARVRKRSWKRDEELGRRVSARFGDRPLDQITRQEIQTFHASLLAEGLAPATADHHVKLVRQALNLAVEWGMLEKNPASRVRLFNVDNKVEHYMDEAQLEGLLTVLRTHENRSVCLMALFLLSTGCRLNEALRATWSQVDRETRVWRIPAATSKSKKIRSVPLNDSALQVLTEIGTEGLFDHVFVNRLTQRPYTTIHKVWGRIRKKAGLPHLRIHDLRHQYASFLVNSGRTLYEVQQILGHSDPSVTQRYAHLSSKSLQDAANCASLAIQGTRQ